MSIVVYFILVSSTFISTTHHVDGKRSISKAKEDNIEIERQLRVLNKKPVKTITNKFGDIIDCIDIYKQPSFDNPLLKDHKIQMSQSSLPGETTKKANSSSSMFRGEGCPSGTIPIRRTTREDLVNAKNIIERAKSIYSNDDSNTTLTNHFVFVEEVIEGKMYYGGSASISLHDLTLFDDEYSTSQIWISNGPLSENFNTIEIGIRHDPLLFGDSRARLFSSWTRDGYQNTGCLNMFCEGFVQTHPSVTFGTSFTIINASFLRYGGFVSKTSEDSTPPMGNGESPQLNDFTKTAYMYKMKYFNEAGIPVDLDRNYMETQNSSERICFDIVYDLDGDLTKSWGFTAMSYGGPGGICP
ncbi:hypothetical protein MKW94_021230 [Papaver nudicaule]|uniref:Neprosin PEP catalytic domain-containing protein n=1 Tax=Papaver nudicaule TaxID=74823 RepID=A0AA41RRK2_PAPNU|nr:hypothetical protein [Papaver nudicaule]